MTVMFDLRAQRIVVTGGAGFLGRRVVELLRQQGCAQVIVPRRAECDLTREEAVARLFADARPDIVIHLAAEVGGIGANQRQPGRFFHANLAMGLHLIEHARLNSIRKLIYVGTICSYPAECPLPFFEEDLWSGSPEPTNAPYGIAKKALGVMLEAYFEQYALPSAYLLPSNLYGPGADDDAATSHVIPALIRTCMNAIERGEDRIVVWGTGRASRDFLHVDDAAEAIVRAAERIDRPEPINLGTGRETTIRRLASMIAELTGFRGEIVFDPSRPDGQARRSVDAGRAWARLGWMPRVELGDGLARMIESMRGGRAVAFSA